MTSNTVLLLILAVIMAIMMAYFQYFYKTKGKSKTIIGLSFLRFSAILSLLVLLINPKIKSTEYEEVKPRLNILVDNSSSIAYANEQANIQAFIKQLKDNKPLNKTFSINYYAFSDDLYLQDTFTYKESGTNIVQSLKSLQDLHKGSVAPTILITDGNQTQGANYTFTTSNHPIYPVIVGDTLQYDDLKINQVNINSYTNLNNYFPVEIFVGYDGDQVINKTLNVYQNNNVVFHKQLTFTREKSSQKIQFDLPANSVGSQNFKCSIATLKNENNTINNQKRFTIEVVDEQAKILILSAVKHPDIGMIKRAISSNKQHKVIVENDLDKNIQYKDYQLIIVYQPNVKFKKIFKDLDVEKTNVFIITGTITDWNFLNDAQPYFSKKQIDKTEVYTPSFNADFDEFIIDDIDISNFNPLEDYFGDVSFSIPYKTIFFQNISNFTTKKPLLATFSIDNRRGAVLFGENSWKWRIQSHVNNNSFVKFDRFFNKLIQYVSSSKKYNRLEIDYQPFLYANKDVIIKAQFFDATYVFDKNANLTLSLTNKRTKETKKIPFTLKNKHYEVVIGNLNAANYSFSVTTENKKDSKYGRFTILPYDIEQQLTTANTKDLRSLANHTKGTFHTISSTAKLVKELLEDKKYRTIQKSKEQIISLIDWKWVLPFILFLLSVEWFVRKYYGKI